MTNKKPEVETFPNGRKKRKSKGIGTKSEIVKEYNGINVPPPPDFNRDKAAKQYIVRLGSKAAGLTWEKAFHELGSAGITPGKPFDTMDDLVSGVLALIAKGASLRYAVGMLHVGQCTTYSFEAIDRYIRDNHQELFDAAIQISNKKYLDELERYVFDENVDTRDIGPRAEILKWLLEKRNPSEFGKKTNHEVTGKDGGPIQQENHVVFHLPFNPRNPQIGTIVNSALPTQNENLLLENVVDAEVEEED